MDTVSLASSWNPAALTFGVTLYAAVTLICIATAVACAHQGRRRLAAVMACLVGVLTVAGVVVAILSSIH